MITALQLAINGHLPPTLCVLRVLHDTSRDITAMSQTLFAADIDSTLSAPAEFGAQPGLLVARPGRGWAPYILIPEVSSGVAAGSQVDSFDPPRGMCTVVRLGGALTTGLLCTGRRKWRGDQKQDDRHVCVGVGSHYGKPIPAGDQPHHQAVRGLRCAGQGLQDQRQRHRSGSVLVSLPLTPLRL